MCFRLVIPYTVNCMVVADFAVVHYQTVAQFERTTNLEK